MTVHVNNSRNFRYLFTNPENKTITLFRHRVLWTSYSWTLIDQEVHSINLACEWQRAMIYVLLDDSEWYLPEIATRNSDKKNRYTFHSLKLVLYLKIVIIYSKYWKTNYGMLRVNFRNSQSITSVTSQLVTSQEP